MAGLAHTGASALGDAWRSVRPYADQTRRDRALQRRMLAASVTALAAARRIRLRRKPTAAQLAHDPVLRAEFVELIAELDTVRRQLHRSRPHRVRNSIIALGGLGLIATALERRHVAVWFSAPRRSADASHS